MHNVLSYIDAQGPAFIRELEDFLRFPSISTLPEHKGDTRQCAEWLTGHLQNIGFPQVQLFETAGHPIVYASWIVDPQKPTILIYGHYDVQPPDPLEEWKTTPFEPTVKDNYIYARGASDDKGQIFTHLKAIEAFVRSHGKPPVNIKLLIEGEEETTSHNIEKFVQEHSEMLKADLVCISDSWMRSTDIPCLTYSLRGIACFEITVQTADQDLHSGQFGGPAPNPLKELAHLIRETERGVIEIPGFYDDVMRLDSKLRALVNSRTITFDEFKRTSGVYGCVGEAGFSIPELIGLRPTFEVHGISGGFTGQGFKTVIPAKASAKISFRLVPYQDPKRIGQIFRDWLDKFFWGYKFGIQELGYAKWWLADSNHPIYEKARLALMKGFKAKETGGVFEGGSIPIVPILAEIIGCPIVVIGFGMADDNLHAPNERFGLDRFFGGIRTIAHFFNEVAQGGLIN